MSTEHCFECGAIANCEHHLVPRSLGGTKTIPLCVACHSKIHSAKLISCSRLCKMGLDRYRSLDGLTALAGLIEMADWEGIPLHSRNAGPTSNILSRKFLDFCQEQGWGDDTSDIKGLFKRLRDIHREDPDYFSWILHDRPIGCDVRYPWVGLVQITLPKPARAPIRADGLKVQRKHARP
jgi:hypothetical protein